MLSCSYIIPYISHEAWAIVYYLYRAVQSLNVVIFNSSHAFSLYVQQIIKMLSLGTDSANLSSMNQVVELQSINIQLDSSVASITRVASMDISGAIANGIVIAQNANPNIKICKDRIEFGKCYAPELQGLSGNLYPTMIPFPNYYLEFGNLIYYFDKRAYKLSIWNKSLDYKGVFPPTTPDNPAIFDMIYPRFAK